MYTAEVQRELFNLSKSLLGADPTAYLQQEKPTAALAAEQALELHRLIVYHEWRYYVLNDPVLSDFEYDSLYKRLEALEAWYPELISTDSPTQRVSNDLTEDFATVEHLVPMLSLANSYNADDLNDFDAQIKKLGGLDAGAEVEYNVEPKFDGGSIALVFEKDLLMRAATRGNGQSRRGNYQQCPHHAFHSPESRFFVKRNSSGRIERRSGDSQRSFCPDE